MLAKGETSMNGENNGYNGSNSNNGRNKFDRSS